jgi:uncharacterized protein (UPF0303 family)
MIRKQIHITEQQNKELQSIIEDTGLKQSELFRRALDGLLQSRVDWWDRAPQAVRDSINRAEEDIEAGRVISGKAFREKHGL